MKALHLFIYLAFFSGSSPLLSQTGGAAGSLRFDGVYFTKPQRSSNGDVWSVRCLRFYADKTVILTSEIYPDQGFDMSRFGKQFNKEQMPPETARGTYHFRNDSLLFSTESYFKGASQTHTISNTYRALTISPESLKLERQNDYSEAEVFYFNFRKFLKNEKK